ncbi:MAG: GerMN domain-containing protein [Lachnospiraceae bacterium]|nr:GerMN domain-containing protein [Lachnospiraceae bacterium]
MNNSSFRKISLIFVCFITMALILTGCKSKKSKETYNGYYIFGINATETKVSYEKYKPKSDSSLALIDEFIKKMQQEPHDLSMKKAIPDDVKIDDSVLAGSGELSLYLNAAYSNYTGTAEILRRAAIVKTLCQIPDVKAVEFYVAGQPLTNSKMETIGLMTSDLFIDNTDGEKSYKQQATLNIYFADSSGTSLIKEPVKIQYDATLPLEELAVRQLIKGPSTVKNINSKKLLPTVPKGTILNKITTKENTCYIDFSDDFLKKPNNITDEVAIYSVVNTLIELPTINKVQFSINGEQVLIYNDKINFGDAFKRNLDIVRKTD